MATVLSTLNVQAAPPSLKVKLEVNPPSGLAITVNDDRFIVGADGSFTAAREGASVRMHQSAYQVAGGSVPLAVYDVEGDNKKPVAYVKADGSATVCWYYFC